MGSVNSPSSSLLNLLQTLSAESPVLASVLSGPGVQAALAKEPAGDLVQLSDAAVKMQEASLLFPSADYAGLSLGFDPPDPAIIAGE